MKKKAILYLVLMPLMALVATSCEKDEDGYYLSSVYTTASYDSINYIDRKKSLLPVFPGIPSPDSQLLTNSSTVSDSNIFPVLFIETWLKPVEENMQQSFDLNIYLRNIEPGKDLVGREFAISPSDAFTRDYTTEALSIIARDKIDVVAMYYRSESYGSATFIPCSGVLRITEYDERNNNISGEFSLSADGKPLKGNFYKISLGNN